MTILFSVVGKNDLDPQNHEADSLSSICYLVKQLQPSKLLLYWTAELMRDPGRKLLEDFLRDLQPTIEIEALERPDLNNPHEFGIFYDDFKKELTQAHFTESDRLAINLSSGTPAAKEGLRTVINFTQLPFGEVSTYQVANPNYPGERCFEDQAESFKRMLKRKTVQDYIAAYNYEAVLKMIQDDKQVFSRAQRSKVVNQLEPVMKTMKQQKLLPDVQDQEQALAIKALINAWLRLDFNLRRGNSVEVLIGLKTLVEGSVVEYLDRVHQIIYYGKDRQPKLNEKSAKFESVSSHLAAAFEADMRAKGQYDELRPYNHKQTLNLISMKNSLACLEPENTIIKLLDQFCGEVNNARNRVAHQLKPIERADIANLKRYVANALEVLIELQGIDSAIKNYWDDYQKSLIKILAE